jgi:predicted regulator of Ras-like GTPase activity (Roadblock/LC7/MglB family)
MLHRNSVASDAIHQLFVQLIRDTNDAVSGIALIHDDGSVLVGCLQPDVPANRLAVACGVLLHLADTVTEQVQFGVPSQELILRTGDGGCLLRPMLSNFILVVMLRSFEAFGMVWVCSNAMYDHLVQILTSLH